jgi:hypothetical protein
MFWAGSSQDEMRGFGPVQPIASWRGFGTTSHVLFPFDWSAYRAVTERHLAGAFDSLLDDKWSTAPRLHAVLSREAWASDWLHPEPATLRVAAGWPARSLRGWGPASAWLEPKMGSRIATTRQGEGAIVKVRRFGGQDIIYLLPWKPIWPGFAINTLFYATMLWALCAVPLALRRRGRMKRGLCPACGYPIGASELCTECGKPVTRDRMRRASSG